jgi:hypothetical protein
MQLAAGAILGTINCALSVFVLQSNAAAMVQFDGFLKSPLGKFMQLLQLFWRECVDMCPRVGFVPTLGGRSRIYSISKGVVFLV